MTDIHQLSDIAHSQVHIIRAAYRPIIPVLGKDKLDLTEKQFLAKADIAIHPRADLHLLHIGSKFNFLINGIA